MGRRSQFTPAQKRDAVLAVLAKSTTVSAVCESMGITEPTFTRWRKQALRGIEQALEDHTKTSTREHTLERKLLEARRSINRLEVENELLGRCVAATSVSERTALGRLWMTEGVAPVATIAKVLAVSRQALYKGAKSPSAIEGDVDIVDNDLDSELDARECDDTIADVDARGASDLIPTGVDWTRLKVRPGLVELDLAVRVMAHRHPDATKRELTSRLRRKGYDVTRKMVARVLDGETDATASTGAPAVAAAPALTEPSANEHSPDWSPVDRMEPLTPHGEAPSHAGWSAPRI